MQIVFGVGIVLVLGASAAWQFREQTTALPPPPVSEPTTTRFDTPASLDIQEVSITPVNYPIQTSFAVAEGDSIALWNFQGAYTDNPELMAKAQNEINRLSELLTIATSSAMILSIGIANQYELLGDGKKQYEYLGRAIQANPENGLPWHNLGVLMERLGAYKTARIAYEKSTLVQSGLKLHHYAYLEFLIAHMKDDAVHIERAFAFAEKNIGKTQYLADLRVQWKKL